MSVCKNFSFLNIIGKKVIVATKSSNMRILFKVQLLFLLLTLFQPHRIHAQGSAPGKTTLVEGHHIVGVKNLNSTIPLKYSFESNYSFRNVPGYDRPYQEGGSTINNFMSDAALAIDWWTLFGEPAEQYGFVWKARNYYEITVPASTGGGTTEVKTVSKSNLSKYPDLLMRYEALKPTEVALEIEWGFGVTDGDIFDQTGYSFISYYGTQNKFKTAISSANILTEPSGKSPFAVPGIRQGKGEAFLGLPNDFPKDKVRLLMQLFATTKYFYITQVNITKIKWPITEMKNIAELYDKYEKGELDPAPLQIINEELKKTQNLSAYNNNDFWSEAFEDEKIKIYADQSPGNEYNSRRNIKIGKISVDNVEPRVGYMQIVLNKNVDWHKVDYDNNLFDFILHKDAKNLQSVYGVIAKKYKKILTQVYIPGTGSNNDKREFRVYDYTGNILYRESSPRYSSTRTDYILLANTPYVLINWMGFTSGYNYPSYIEGATLLNLQNLQKITIPKFSNRSSDLIPLIYDKNDLIKDWDSGTKRLIESIRTEINTYKVVIIIPRYGEQPGKTYYEHAIYGITNDDRFVHIRNNIR